MKRTRVTASEVARRAGVSQPTVSRVFSNPRSVSVEKAERVRAVARELGYIPNSVARSLTSGRTHNIGIVLAYLKNGFFADALQRLSKALNAKGYSVTVYFAANSPDEVDLIVDDLLAHQVDGIILASVSMSNTLTDRLKSKGIPFVLFNRGQRGSHVPMVTASNVQGARGATQFLIDSGHRRIAHLAGWKEALNGIERQEGFLSAMAGAGMTPYDCVDCHFRRSVAMEETRRMFRDGPGPDAIFAGNDHMAFGVLEVLRVELGLRVPEDVSVIGYDDAPMAAWKAFDLTTVRQPLDRMVKEAVAILDGYIHNPEAAVRKVELTGDLVVRGTARLPEGYGSCSGNGPQDTESHAEIEGENNE